MGGPWTTNTKLRETNSNTDVYKVLVTDAIDVIDADVNLHRDKPEYDGLPLEIFHLCSRLTPLLNIDLLIKDENNRTLLAWRDDEFAGEGWHLPGGIVRFKETLEDRVRQVVEIEIDAPVEVDLTPLAHHEVILSHETRGHAYSVLYKGQLKVRTAFPKLVSKEFTSYSGRLFRMARQTARPLLLMYMRCTESIYNVTLHLSGLPGPVLLRPGFTICKYAESRAAPSGG